MKKIWIRLVTALTVAVFLYGCAGKKEEASFFDLKKGMTAQEIEKLLGKEYEKTSAPVRMIYTNISLTDSVTDGKDTKLSCFLDDTGKCQLYAYYIYSAAKADYNSLQNALTEKFGEADPGENENTIEWAAEDGTVTLTDAGSYFAVGYY